MTISLLREDKAKIVDMAFTIVKELCFHKITKDNQVALAHLFNLLRQNGKPMSADCAVRGDPLTGETHITLHLRNGSEV